MEKYSFFKFFNRDLKHLQNIQIDQIINNKSKYRQRVVDQDSFNIRYPSLNLEFYKNNHLDLQKMNKYELMYHYHFNGRKEKRICNISEFKNKYPNYDKEVKDVDIKLVNFIFGDKINTKDKTSLYIYLKLKLPNIFYTKKIKNDIKKNNHKSSEPSFNSDIDVKQFKNYEYLYDKLVSSDFKRLDYRIMNEGCFKDKICHIHLGKNFNYNKTKINTLQRNFTIIFTYSNEKVKINKEFTYLNIDMRGGRYGGQLVCINYLKKKKINYTSILFLDDNIDVFQDKEKTDFILKNFDSNNGAKIIFDSLEYKNHHNKYLEELSSYWKLSVTNVKNNGFMLIKKDIVDSIIPYENLLFTLLNNFNSLDINWISNYYNLQHLDISEIRENISCLKLDFNAYQKEIDISFMFEDIFNYIWVNTAIENNLKILVKNITNDLKNQNLVKNYKILDFENINDNVFENNITNNFLNNNKVISIPEFYSILSSIKNNNINITQIFYNLFKTHDDVKKYFESLNLDFESINKNIKRICDNSTIYFKENLYDYQYLINKLVNDFDVNIYKIFNIDLSNYSDEKLLEHWILYGFYEGRIYSINKFKQTYPEFNKKTLSESKNQIDEIFKNNFKNFKNTEMFKFEVVYHYININNINLKKTNTVRNEHKKMNKIALLVHCGNYDIFTDIYKDYPNLFDVYHIYISCHTYEIKDKLSSKFKNATILVCENRGCDIGGFLKIIDYILKINDEYDYYILVHTKTDKEWRDKMLKPISHMVKKNNEFEESDEPRIYSSFKNIESNHKLINNKNIIKILKRNQLFKQEVYDYFDQLYPDDFYDKNNSINLYGGLFPDEKFYSYYENLDIQHYYKNGVTEFHRISNVNYIKKFSDENSNFVAGTCFICNKKYFDIFKKFDDLSFEFNDLEKGKVYNKKERKTHSWEYLFGLLCYLNKGNIIDIYSNNIVTSNRDIKKYSCINVPFSKSEIAFVLIIPNGNFINGGYRTLLNYINYINKQGKSVDIYFGECWDEKDLILNYTTNNHGMPSCLNWFQKDMEYYIKQMKKYNTIDVTKNNFYVGINFQKPYKYGIANAWQTAQGVYKNIDKCENIMYVIQDREYLFYNDEILINSVKSTYHSDFKYYYLSKYLSTHFQQKYNFPNYIESQLSANSEIYYDMNLKRQKKVILFYYPDKKGRVPDLIKEITLILTKNNIKCVVLPFKFKYDSMYIEFLDPQTPIQLNKLYNNCKVGIVFSNTNPSRLCYEMFFSGLNVIEYDSESTKYDISSDYFTKIKDSKNITEIVQILLEKDVDIKIRQNFIKKYNRINELQKFYDNLD